MKHFARAVERGGEGDTEKVYASMWARGLRRLRNAGQGWAELTEVVQSKPLLFNCRLNKEVLVHVQSAAHNHNIVGEPLMVNVSRVRAEIRKSPQKTVRMLWALMLCWHVLYLVLHFVSLGNLWTVSGSLSKANFTLLQRRPPIDRKFVENELTVRLCWTLLQVHSYVKYLLSSIIWNPLTVWRLHCSATALK